MKLRIKGNSMRLRVSPSEIARLLQHDCLEETIHFGPQPDAILTYALQQKPTVNTLTVQYMANRLAVLIPANQADTWAMTDQVGIAENISLGELGTLAVLIEKDFACLDRSDEDNEDTFQNPNAGATCQVGQS
jgi:hypothetical protein